MPSTITPLVLTLLTLFSIAAWVLALGRLRGDRSEPGKPWQQGLVVIIGVGAGLLFVVRYLWVHQRWQPLAAHVDGLLLIAALFAAAILYIQNRSRLWGLSAFALPVLTLILTWGICASAWTYRPFDLATLHPVWMGLHLAGVYLGTLGAAAAAIAGGMYLYVQHQLKHKQHLANLGRLASLETLERMIVRTSALGFGLLTLGLAAGLVVLSGEPAGEPGWWYGPKIGLAVGAWLVYALLMNIRFATRFRGTRAAWLAILGLVLLLTTYGLITAAQVAPPQPPPRPSSQGMEGFLWPASPPPPCSPLSVRGPVGRSFPPSSRRGGAERIAPPLPALTADMSRPSSSPTHGRGRI